MRIEEGKDKSFALSAVCGGRAGGLIALRYYVASFFPSEGVMVLRCLVNLAYNFATFGVPGSHIFWNENILNCDSIMGKGGKKT